MSDRATRAALRQRHREAGLCVHCSTPAVPGKVMCEKHLEAARAATKRAQDRKAHPCAKCGARCVKTNLCRRCSTSISWRKRDALRVGRTGALPINVDDALGELTD